ncbi:MAG: M48 family peptidase [Wenzhouxiangella sp.]|nr:MAG: M48 family peptidase [Wenzhouxiangella sp.]
MFRPFLPVSTESSESSELPYRVRVHPRARHVRLRIDPRQGLIVTVPARFDRRRIPALLADRAEWIRRVQDGQAAIRNDHEPALLGNRPARISLPAIDREWSVDYRTTRRRRLALEEQTDRLVFHLPALADDALDQRISVALKKWLLASGRHTLPQWVAHLAAAHGFRYGAVRVRNQRSRWGSCSSRGDLSINARLLFCPAPACEYVLVHELVHTVHPDHSPAFWNRVAELVPDYQRQQSALTNAWLCLPEWV